MSDRILWDTIEEQRVCIERLRGLLLELHGYQADVWNPVYWRPKIAALLAGATVQPAVALCSPDTERTHLLGLDGLCWRCGKRFAVIADPTDEAP